MQSLAVRHWFIAFLWVWIGISAPAQTASQSIIDLDPETERAFVCRRYAGSVAAADLRERKLIWETRVGQDPGRIRLARIGGEPRILVSCENEHAVVVLDPENGKILDRLAVGKLPRGFAVVGGRYLVTALHAHHQVSVWDLEEKKLVQQIAVDQFPAEVAYSARRSELYVSYYFSGDVSVLSADDFKSKGRIEGPPQAGQVSGLLLNGDESLLWVSYTHANSDLPDPKFVSAVMPVLGAIDLDLRGYVKAKHIPLSFIGKPVNGPMAMAFIRKGAALVSVNSRSDDLSVINHARPLLIANVDVGKFPAGIAVGPGETYVAVANAHDNSISMVDLKSFKESQRLSLGDEVLPPAVARGRDLFHDAKNPRMSQTRWINCSNCHPDGRADGRTWQLPGKPRHRTKDLHGLVDTLPAGWLGNQDEMQDEELFIRNFQHGYGLADKEPNPMQGDANLGLSADLDALSAYVYWLRFKTSPHTDKGRLVPAAQRGQRLFQSQQTRCLTCHPPPFYTISSPRENQTFAGLTQADPKDAPALDVPSLLGLYLQPRFLQDGRASSLKDVFSKFNPRDAHGKTSQLSNRDLDDLTIFLLSLPFDEDGGSEKQKAYNDPFPPATGEKSERN